MDKKLKKNVGLMITIHVGLILLAIVILVVTQVRAKPLISRSSQLLTSGNLSYQGTLMNSGGTPLTGDYEMTFSLYNSMVRPFCGRRSEVGGMLCLFRMACSMSCWAVWSRSLSQFGRKANCTLG